jgi:hypothetical protein
MITFHCISKRTAFLIILFLSLFVNLHAQNFKYPFLPKAGKNYNNFIPKRWFLKDSVSGDLNGDQKPDLVIIMECVDIVSERDNSIGNASPRILLILFKTETGIQKLFKTIHLF